MTSPYARYSTRKTPQSEPIPGENQVKNNAGGFVYEIDDWARLDRVLILGTSGGTCYVGERELTIESADAVMRCISADGPRTVNRIAEISMSGRAARNDPAIFALALCLKFGDVTTRRLAADSIRLVCRIGTHLFHLAQYCDNLGKGWGRVLKRGFAEWYENQNAPHLAYQMIKYRQRDGWTHKDLITLSHPRAHAHLYDWVLTAQGNHERKAGILDLLPTIIEGYEEIQRLAAGESTKARELILQYRLPREAVPSHFLNNVNIWSALLETDMPIEAMIRNLGNMSKVGLLTPFSVAVRTVTDRLGNADLIRNSRLHPIKLLTALKVYEQGHGIKGDGKWDVVPQIVDALDAAFYTAFKNVAPSGKNIMLALDVSGSMSSGQVAGAPLSPREASAALALVTANVEPNYMIFAFGDKFAPLNISAKTRLGDAVRAVGVLGMQRTDCALPMLHASQKGIDNIDAFTIYTDNETWVGSVHPSQALRSYRQNAKRPSAKLAVVAMTPTQFSIADPKDAGMMDVVGFDTDTPAMISEFIAS